MLVLIDESGDPGFKLQKGSSSHFVMAMTIFQEDSDAERAGAAIARCRARLNVKPEFKFAKSCDHVRDEFFGTVCPLPFVVRGMVVDKSAIRSSKLRDDTETFYNYFVKMLLQYDNGALADARIKIDGSGDKKFRNELNAYLRRMVGGKVSSIRFVDSKANNLVQLADMCAGAILRGRRADNRDDRWLSMLRKAGRIGNLWDFR